MAAIKKIRSTPSSKAEDNLLTRLASFPELNPNPIYEIDFSGTIVYANPAARKLRADGLASIVGDNAKELVEAFSGQNGKELVREIQVGGRWYRQSIHSVPGAEVLRVYDVDITKSKQVSMYLDFQQTFLSSILEQINTAVVACNEKGELVLFNRMARDWHGLDPIKIPQTQWAEYYNLYLEDGTTPMDIKTIPLARAFRGETVHDIGMVIAARGQAKRYILANAGPVKDKDGRVLGAVAVMYDITERKLMEDALRASEERFRRVFQYSAAGMVLVAPDGRYLHVNDAFQKMLGFTEKELQQMTFNDATSPEDRPATVEFVRQALAGEIETFCFEKRYLRKNKDVIWGLVSSTLIRDANNQPVHFIAQIQDIW
jgi:PAS domain S-box-containing protein